MWDKLRKFGLQYCDLPTMIWNLAFLLKPLILDIDSRNTKRIPIVLYVLAAVIAISFFHVYVLSMLWFVFWRCPQTGDMVAASVVLSLGVSSEIGIVKLIYMIVYSKEIRYLVEKYLECDSLVVLETRFSNNLLRTLRAVKKRAMLFWIVIICNGLLYMTVPLFVPGRHLTEDLYVIYGLEPMFQTPNYYIAYMLSALGVCCICYPPANITAFLMVIIGYTEAQMLALSEELTNLWADAEENYQSYNIQRHSIISHDQDLSINTFEGIEETKKQTLNKYINLRLKDIIKTHATNINLLGQVENIFRGAVILELGLLIVTLISELLGGLENTFLQMPFALIQVGMDCLTGQRVMDASEIGVRLQMGEL